MALIESNLFLLFHTTSLEHQDTHMCWKRLQLDTMQWNVNTITLNVLAYFSTKGSSFWSWSERATSVSSVPTWDRTRDATIMPYERYLGLTQTKNVEIWLQSIINSWCAQLAAAMAVNRVYRFHSPVTFPWLCKVLQGYRQREGGLGRLKPPIHPI